MAQITITLDEDTEKRMQKLAEESGMSESEWVAAIIRERTMKEWPDSVKKLVGAWQDFPSAEELRKGLGRDTGREPL